MQDLIKKELQEASDLLNAFVSDQNNLKAIEVAARIMSDAISNGNKIYSCGNGGSMCDAMHFAEEMTGRFRLNRKALPAVAISDPSHITCVANDFGFDEIFSRYLEAHVNKGDVLLAISTSGNSKNILSAAKYAKQNKIKVIGLSGKDGGELSKICDHCIVVSHAGFADRIQEIHIKIIHILILLIEKNLQLSND
ncbi:MAG TPA: D-sedoheptulose 7-phosphate isomerase [Bacteroidia bacterium]|nr:D-sedoheptulose 7-phosphate isomerase [Bacteroidia bacterium]